MISSLGFFAIKILYAFLNLCHVQDMPCLSHSFVFQHHWVTVTNYESGWEMKQPYWTILVTKALRTIQIKKPVTTVVLSKDELPP